MPQVRHSRPLADSSGNVPTQQVMDDLRCPVDLVEFSETRPEEHFVHSYLQACFKRVLHLFRGHRDGMEQIL